MEEMQKVLNVVHQSQTENVNSVDKKNVFGKKSWGAKITALALYIIKSI